MKKLIALLLVLMGCTQNLSAPGTLVQSNKARLQPSTLASVDTSALSHTQNQFAFDMYQKLRSSDDNILFSPYSLSTALTMVYAGAQGQTATEMAATLHLPNNTNVYAASNKLDDELTSPTSYQLNTANALFVDTLFQSELKMPFLDILSENYGAGVHVLDFMNHAEDSRQAINNWVSQKTQNKIIDLLPSGSIKSDTALVITNAVYLNAPWANPFLVDNTHNDTFHGAQDSTVPMMEQTNTYDYVENSDLQAIELPYDGNQLAMVVILPKNNLSTLETKLDATYFSNIVAQFQAEDVALSLPQFSFTEAFEASETLKSLGMIQAFNVKLANFTGIADDPNRPLYIGAVHHKAFIKVTEKGTEAAAATAVDVLAGSAMPGKTVDMTVNKPFIFVIRDRQTGVLLFVGRVLKL